MKALVGEHIEPFSNRLDIGLDTRSRKTCGLVRKNKHDFAEMEVRLGMLRDVCLRNIACLCVSLSAAIAPISP